MHLDDLRALRARLDAATGPDREIDQDLFCDLGLCPRGEDGLLDAYRAPHYTASLDAAVALVERIAPDLDVHLFSECGGYFAFVEEFKDSRHVRYDGFAGEGVDRDLWPSAVLSAALTALIARSEAEAGRG